VSTFLCPWIASPPTTITNQQARKGGKWAQLTSIVVWAQGKFSFYIFHLFWLLLINYFQLYLDSLPQEQQQPMADDQQPTTNNQQWMYERRTTDEQKTLYK